MTKLEKLWLSLGIIACVIIVTLTTVVAVCWEYIQGKILGKTYYTEEQLEEKYNDGYNDGNVDKEESDKIIAEYKLQLAENQSEKDILTVKIEGLQTQNAEYLNQIENVTLSRDNALAEVTELEDEIIELNEDLSQANIELSSVKYELELAQNQNILNLEEIEGLERKIASLNFEIEDLENKILENESDIAELEESLTEKETELLSVQYDLAFAQNQNTLNLAEIDRLEAKIVDLNEYISDLEDVHSSNLSTISNLNNQLVTFSKQVVQLTTQIETNNQLISTYQAKVTKLENSISYYENFISQLISSDKVLATFEFDGQVYAIQIVDKNGYAESLTPVSTDTAIFNYWTVNDSQVDVSSYQLTANTKFIANITHKYEVNFIANGEEFVTSQFVVENGFATEPVETPTATQEHYVFAGWSINGVDIVDIESYAITSNTAFYPIFELEQITISVYSSANMGSLLYSGSVSYGSYLSELDYTPVPEEDYKFVYYYPTGFNLSPEEIYPETYVVTSALSIYPVFEQYVSNITIYDGDQIIYSNKVEKGTTIDLSTVEPLGHEGYRFVGFYTSTSTNISNSQYTIVEDIPTLTNLICTSDSYTYYARYENLSDGYFTLSSGTGVGGYFDNLYIGYYLSGDIYYGFVNDYCDTAFRSNYLDESSDLANGYMKINYPSGYYYIGNYDEDSDTWVFECYVSSTDEHYSTSSGYNLYDFTMSRAGYSVGASYSLIESDAEETSLVA